jgi:hypothetical protein
MVTEGAGEVLSYRSSGAVAPLGRNWPAVVAFISALVFNPLLRLAVTPRPFWSGHPLHWIRQIVESIPVLALPLPGVVLGVCALAYARACGRRRGLALAATVIGVAWYVLLGGLFLFFAVGLRGWNN